MRLRLIGFLASISMALVAVEGCGGSDEGNASSNNGVTGADAGKDVDNGGSSGSGGSGDSGSGGVGGADSSAGAGNAEDAGVDGSAGATQGDASLDGSSVDAGCKNNGTSCADGTECCSGQCDPDSKLCAAACLNVDASC